MKQVHNTTRAKRRYKEKLVEAFGGACVRCGYDKYSGAMDFHHTDPSLKEHRPGMIIHQWGTDRAMKQLLKEKCILVCKNCHAEIHDLMYDYEVVELDYKIPEKRTCKICDGGYWTIRDEQKFCSVECNSISQRKVERPPYDELKELVDKFNYTRVGRMFGVSDNAIRKWLKKYESEMK